jgi:hypothetical protein
MHHSKVEFWPFKNFTPKEMACRCGCGEIWPDGVNTIYLYDFMYRLQFARTDANTSFKINSAHRCAIHNAMIGGAPMSQHKRMAADIGIRGKTGKIVESSCRKAGFKGFGYYASFLHVDMGSVRNWYSNKKARSIWNG